MIETETKLVAYQYIEDFKKKYGYIEKIIRRVSEQERKDLFKFYNDVQNDLFNLFIFRIIVTN